MYFLILIDDVLVDRLDYRLNNIIVDRLVDRLDDIFVDINR